MLDFSKQTLNIFLLFLTVSCQVKIKTILYLELKHWPCSPKSVWDHQAIRKCNHRPGSGYFDDKKTFEERGEK